MNSNSEVQVVSPSGAEDAQWLQELWRSQWAGDTLVSCGRVYHLEDLECRIAWKDGARAGAATFFHHAMNGCELMTIDALTQYEGVGTVLLRDVEEQAVARGCRRIWLITSNDNLSAMRFYQRRGYRLCAVYHGAIDLAREFKPSIPLVGHHDIPIRDEVELEKFLAASNE